MNFEKNDFLDETKKILFDCWKKGKIPDHKSIEKIRKIERKFNYNSNIQGERK